MAKVNGNANCIIGEGSVVEGKFYVEGSIRIEGKFQGSIKTEDQLIVSPSGKVKTDITARAVTVAGTLIGNIIATEEVNIIENGKVLGNIFTPKLNLEPGVITQGQVTITSASTSDESVENVISKSYGEDASQLFKPNPPKRQKKEE